MKNLKKATAFILSIVLLSRIFVDVQASETGGAEPRSSAAEASQDTEPEAGDTGADQGMKDGAAEEDSPEEEQKDPDKGEESDTQRGN